MPRYAVMLDLLRSPCTHHVQSRDQSFLLLLGNEVSIPTKALCKLDVTMPHYFPVRLTRWFVGVPVHAESIDALSSM